MEFVSRIIISLFTKLLHGLDPKNISPNWRLLSTMNLLKSLMNLIMVIIPSHFRREANKIASKIAKIGVSNGGNVICIRVDQQPIPPLLQDCFEMAHSKCNAPDGVPPSPE